MSERERERETEERERVSERESVSEVITQLKRCRKEQ